MSIDIYIKKLKDTGIYDDDTVNLAAEDKKYGLSDSQISLYLKKNMNIYQRKMVSEVLREGISDEFFAFLSSRKSGIYMQIALEHYKKGISENVIMDIMNKYGSLAQIKNSFAKFKECIEEDKLSKDMNEKLLEQVYKLTESIKLNDTKCDELAEHLMKLGFFQQDTEYYDKLQKENKENEIMLNEKQDEINKAQGALARARNEANEYKKKLELVSLNEEQLSKEVSEYKSKLDESRELEERLSEKIDELNTTIDILQDEIKHLEKESDDNYKEDNEVSSMNDKDLEHNEAVIEEDKIKVYYATPSYTSPVYIETDTRRTQRQMSVLSIISNVCFKKKAKVDIIKLLAAGELDEKQLMQIKRGIEERLEDNQLVNIINSKAPAERMKRIIDIAILENRIR